MRFNNVIKSHDEKEDGGEWGGERNTGIPLLWREQTRGNRWIGDRAFSATVQVAILIYSSQNASPFRWDSSWSEGEEKEKERKKETSSRFRGSTIIDCSGASG